jgi:acetyltransferase-like isoleucine patch superfamily enzyme
MILGRLKSIPFQLYQLFLRFKGYCCGLHYRSISEIHCQAKLLPSARVINLREMNSAIKVGAESRILGELLTFAHGGAIQIGESCYVGENSRIWSALDVKIGNRVLISHNVNIHDTDGHSLDKKNRHEHFNHIVTRGHPKYDLDLRADPVLIQDDVWIGFNVTILKGVTIGEGAIVGAGSVVTHDVTAYSIFAGNPARFIRKVI